MRTESNEFLMQLNQNTVEVIMASGMEEEADATDESLEMIEKENEEQQSAGEDVSLRRPWSQCPGCVFHSPKDRK